MLLRALRGKIFGVRGIPAAVSALLFFSVVCLHAAEEKFVIGTFRNEGFFSSFVGVLNGLIWAEKQGKMPVVHWTEDSYFYQKGGWNGAQNPWEYYFEPVSPLTYKPGDLLHIYCNNPEGFGLCVEFFRDPKYFHKELKSLGKKTIDRYVHIKPEILKKVDLFYQQQMKGKINIGIHLRGTDREGSPKKWETAQALLDAAQTLMKKNPHHKYQFFVATDEEAMLELAKKTLKGHIVYCNATRSLDGTPIHTPKIGEERKGGLLGEEVLIDALLLSKCNYFAHSLSSVGIAVHLFNPTLKSIYFNPLSRRIEYYLD
ncbi:MAG TPA: nodulation protein NodZ [Chlamydiales bacterium]|nr:nodulation protein NodZ [Chlamydiales bacterium]